MEALISNVIFILVLGFVAIASGMRVVPEYQRFVVFRLGRPLNRARGPGIIFLVPILDRAVKVDLREQMREIPPETATTKDYKAVSFAFRWSYSVVDPVQSVLQVGNHEAATGRAATTLFREFIHDIDGVYLSSEGERIRFGVNARLNEITKPWGIKVTQLEIMQLAVDDKSSDMEAASLAANAIGETQTTVHATGAVLIGGRSWDAISKHSIPPQRKVRVTRVVLEVEEDDS